MAEQFDAKEIFGRDFVGFALLDCMVRRADQETEGPGGSAETFRTVFGLKVIEKGVPQPVMVELRINGVEVPIRPFLERMWSGYKEGVLKTAREIVSAKLRIRFNYAEDLLRAFEKTIEREMNENDLPTAFSPEEWLDWDPRDTYPHHLDR